jgi:hypothetical protein
MGILSIEGDELCDFLGKAIGADHGRSFDRLLGLFAPVRIF